MGISVSNPVQPLTPLRIIGSETLSGAAASFSAITVPTGYSIIEVSVTGEVTATGCVTMVFNADTGNNYELQIQRSISALVSSQRVTPQANAVILETIANMQFVVRAFISNNTSWTKAWRGVGNCGAGELTGVCSDCSGYWNNAAEITSITVSSTAGNLKAGSTVLVRGLV